MESWLEIPLKERSVNALLPSLLNQGMRPWVFCTGRKLPVEELMKEIVFWEIQSAEMEFATREEERFKSREDTTTRLVASWLAFLWKNSLTWWTFPLLAFELQFGSGTLGDWIALPQATDKISYKWPKSSMEEPKDWRIDWIDGKLPRKHWDANRNREETITRFFLPRSKADSIHARSYATSGTVKNGLQAWLDAGLMNRGRLIGFTLES